MTQSLHELLRLYTFNNNVENYFIDMENTYPNNFQIQNKFDLCADIQKDFQFCCMDIARLKDEKYPEVKARVEMKELMEKLNSSVSNKINIAVNFSGNTGLTYYDVAKCLIVKVFTPLATATEEISNEINKCNDLNLKLK